MFFFHLFVEHGLICKLKRVPAWSFVTRARLSSGVPLPVVGRPRRRRYRLVICHLLVCHHRRHCFPDSAGCSSFSAHWVRGGHRLSSASVRLPLSPFISSAQRLQTGVEGGGDIYIVSIRLPLSPFVGTAQRLQ